MNDKRHPVRNTFIFILLLPVCAIIFMLSYLMGIDGWREFDPSSILDMEQSAVLYDGQNRAYMRLSNEDYRI